MDRLTPFTFLIRTAQDLRLTLLDRDRLWDRPPWSSKAVALRLAAGLRVLGAYLRRLLVLMALALEPELVVKERPLKRPHGRKCRSRPRFVILRANRPGPEDFEFRDHPRQCVRPPLGAPKTVPLWRLYRQLDLMTAVLADPAARARRLALHLARSRPGAMLAPHGPARIAGRWGTAVSAGYHSMAVDILERSRNRPPPLPPPRRHWRGVTVL